MHDPELGLSVYYLSYAAIPALIWLAFSAAGRSRWRALKLLFAWPLAVIVYARFVEPSLLLAPRHEIELGRCFARGGEVRLALLSDLHIGRFPNSTSVGKITRKLNEIAPDAALIAGDFVYDLDRDGIDAAFAPFAKAEAPIYSVYGNHDVGLAEPDVSGLLDQALRAAGVETIDGDAARLETAQGVVEIAGFTDFGRSPPRREHLESQSEIPRILLAHYPGWADWLRNVHYDVLLAGHTHGGQIRVPGLTCRMSRHACEMTRYGLTRFEGRQVFVTSGTGLVQLPMRFLVPPRIDVLTVRYRSCGEG